MWSIANISKTLPDEVWETLFSSNKLLFSVYAGWMFIPIAYIATHHLLIKCVQPYKDLEPDAQTVVIHHATEAIILSLFFFPMTYLLLSVLFEEQSFDDLEPKFIQLTTMVEIIMALYLMELASRYRNPRPMLVIHHFVALLNGLFLLGFKTNANVKTCLILVYFITFEAITFMSLLMYRLFPLHKATPKLILTGLIVMAISRPFQLLLIFGFIFSAWNDLVKWHAITQIAITVFLTGIQIWSLKIHYKLWKRSVGRHQLFISPIISGSTSSPNVELRINFPLSRI
jgi:hypothetical protein